MRPEITPQEMGLPEGAGWRPDYKGLCAKCLSRLDYCYVYLPHGVVYALTGDGLIIVGSPFLDGRTLQDWGRYSLTIQGEPTGQLPCQYHWQRSHYLYRLGRIPCPQPS